MAMLKLNKIKHADKNKEKIANISSAHHLSRYVFSSAERGKNGLNKVKIYTQLVMLNIFQNQ